MIRIGIDRDGSALCLAIRAPGGMATLQTTVAQAAALAASLTAAVTPDGSEDLELSVRGQLTITIEGGPTP